MERVHIDDKQAPQIFGSGEPGRGGCVIREIEQIFFYEFKKDGVYRYPVPSDLEYIKIEGEPKWDKLNMYTNATPKLTPPPEYTEATDAELFLEVIIYIIIATSISDGITLLLDYLGSFNSEAKSVIKDVIASSQLAEYSVEMGSDISGVISDFAVSKEDFEVNQENLTNEKVIESGLTKHSDPEQFLEKPSLSTFGKMFNKNEKQVTEVMQIRENETSKDSSFFAKVSKNLKQDLGISILESIGFGEMIYSPDEVSLMDIEKSKNTAAAVYKAAENIASGYREM